MIKVLSGERAKRPPSVIATCFATSPAATLHLVFLSGVSNILMLTGPLFMMQVYDRVLASRSLPTLVALSLIAILAYLAIWLLDMLRGRIASLFAERLADEMLPHAKRAAITLQLQHGRMSDDSDVLFRDIEMVRTFGQTQAPMAFLDVPWLPVYVAVAFLLHPVIGWSVVVGIAVLAVMTWLGGRLSRAPSTAAMRASAARQAIFKGIQRNAEAIHAMGMDTAIWQRWARRNDEAVKADSRTGSINSAIGGLSRTFRQVFQSSILALGAFLVVSGELSAGAIIAATILAGRALAPIDQAIANWRPLMDTRASFNRLHRLIHEMPPAVARMALPMPVRSLELDNLCVAAPGQPFPSVRNVSLSLQAGDALGVIGHSASGKTTLARAIAGLWQPCDGKVLLDGADLAHFDRLQLGPTIGFMPQDVQLLDGTIRENIARFRDDATAAQVIAAAKAASFHQHALAFPNGYDTQIGPNGAHLSAGQRQRIGIARALYGNPFLVVLDEPNANLDAEGEMAVARAVRGIRQRGGIAIVIAHRPGAISQSTHLLVLEHGEVTACGPKERVLAQIDGNSRTALSKSAKLLPGA